MLYRKIKHIQYSLHVYTVYIYINTHTCMYIFHKNMLCYILNLYIYNINYMNINIDVNIFKIYTVCVCVYICMINIHSTHIYYANNFFYFG